MPLALLLLACAPAMQSSGLQDIVTERLYFGRNAANTLVVSDSAGRVPAGSREHQAPERLYGLARRG